jgi:hypothetical protein
LLSAAAEFIACLQSAHLLRSQKSSGLDCCVGADCFLHVPSNGLGILAENENELTIDLLLDSKFHSVDLCVYNCVSSTMSLLLLFYGKF